jgi:hypothetical protein
MIVGSASGKAVLVIDRLDSKYVPFSVQACIESCSGGDRDYVTNDFECLDTQSLPVPDAARKLKVGQRVVVRVVYEITYTRDYWGEYDVELEYLKQKVIRRYKAGHNGK